MKLLIDTNVILDILLKREPFFEDSYQAIRTAIDNNDECYISVTAATDIFYILRKALQSAEQAKEYLGSLARLAEFTDVLAVDALDALSSEVADYEDAVVEAVADRIGADYILTRNIKDYLSAKIPAVTPTELLNL
ncbi:MAG: PIN domain-containing protein [Clostridia bacterium]|nr:PIN domain-containing protein [Clostridia bacterium]MBO5128262.1 PIN domain-containing protein [Clostridia bacterium]MBP3293160.1 PIN domain-containing protein [Clostridia bacterium]